MTRLAWLYIVLAATTIAATGRVVRGEVVRVEIHEQTLLADGQVFSDRGPYEKLRGRMLIEVDPDAPANAAIRDLQLAPRNARGRVECWTDFFLLKPTDPLRGNRRLLFDVTNRGNKLALWTFNLAARSNDPSTAADVGDGFLMRRGYSVLWCGWDGDVVEDGNQRTVIDLPVVRQGGETVTGPAHVEICVDEPTFSQAFFYSPWGTSAAYPSVSLDNRDATLTMRPRRSAPAVQIPRTRWSFARWENGRAVPDAAHLYVEEGFRPGWLYDLVYTARDPRVSGLGMAAVRDCVSFFRHAGDDRTPASPLAGCVDLALIFGISQSGRLIHQFVYDGFNADESGRIVFDGALAHVAGAGKGMFNHRFRMATIFASHHTGNLAASELFPFSPAPQIDLVSGQQADTLERARQQGCVPKMMFTQTSTEYWNRAASLLTTDVAGLRDLELPDEVRVYLVAGAQHLGAGPPTPGICQQPRNTLDDRGPLLRAMLVALDRWASVDQPPPPSRYPRIDDGTLVDLETFREQFPKIPGVNLPTGFYQPLRLDFGPRFQSQGIADTIPPTIVGQPYRTLVPAVDSDGNEIAGIRLPDIAVPLGTHTGWNLRAAKFGAEEMLSGLDGMYLPFPATSDERSRQSDPRSAVRERYPTRDVYLARITEAAMELQSEGFLLPEDALAILHKAAQRNHPPNQSRPGTFPKF
ncbi:MAG: hypothetical protein KJ000_06450 [Pirellulaceae bacterium]|nr:hypothetical protein [Pirellulaceae bacterium]